MPGVCSKGMLGCSWIVRCFGKSSKYIIPNGVFSFMIHGHLPYLVESEKKIKSTKKTSGYKPTFTNVSKKNTLKKKQRQTYTKKTSPVPPRRQRNPPANPPPSRRTSWLVPPEYLDDLHPRLVENLHTRPCRSWGQETWVLGGRIFEGPKKTLVFLRGLAESNLS